VSRLERTRVSASEEYLLNVSLWPSGIHLRFIIANLCLNRMKRILAVVPVMSRSSGVFPTLPVSPAIAEKWSELDTPLVERQRMAGVHNGIIHARKRHVPLDQPDRVHGVPARRYQVGDLWTGRTTHHIPRNLISTSVQKVRLNCALNA